MTNINVSSQFTNRTINEPYILYMVLYVFKWKIKIYFCFFFYSTHPSFSLSFSSHDKQNKTIWVFKANKSGSCWCSCQGDLHNFHINFLGRTGNSNNNLKWYMKCFIYWTADLKSSKPWSSQLWRQFKQLHIEAWKSQDFNGVRTCDLAIPVRSSNQLSYEATDVG